MMYQQKFDKSAKWADSAKYAMSSIWLRLGLVVTLPRIRVRVTNMLCQQKKWADSAKIVLCQQTLAELSKCLMMTQQKIAE